MAEKEYWIGTQGPFIYDDTYVLDQEGTTGSQFSGGKPKTLNTDSPCRIGIPEDPEDAVRDIELGETNLQKLNNVSSTDPVDLQILQYNAAESYYEPVNPTTRKLTDVQDVSQSDNDFLRWNNSNARYEPVNVVERSETVVTSVDFANETTTTTTINYLSYS